MKIINLLTIIILIVFSSCHLPTIEQKITDNSIIIIKKEHEYICFHNSIIHSYSCKCLNKQIIDLPEEYSLISHNSNKPDTMISWINNDTLFIRFKH